MRRCLLAAVALVVASISISVVAGQTPVPTGDRTTPLRAVAGVGNTLISNAVLRDQPDVRVLRVVLEPGGTRAMHSHDDVKFHLFVPVSGPMALTVDGAEVVVAPWQPYYMKMSTKHAFRNTGTAAVEILEVFVK